MNLEKLFGSKTKVDILKYLLFKRQGVSMRALESEISWTFPAIKKQVDSLHESNVIDVNKDNQ
jgi:predicted transcriptional regulator